MRSAHYEITVRGRFGVTLAGAFDRMTATAAPAGTVIRGELDQAALHSVLERIDSLGLELLDVRRSPSAR